MDKYRVKIYPTAKQDLVDVIGYLNTLSPEAALRYYDLLTEQIASLSHMPERCPRPKDLALAAKGYRCLVVGKHLIQGIVKGPSLILTRTMAGCFRFDKKI